MSERFRPQEILSGPSGAKVKHFTPEGSGQDRFGNQLFVSKDLVYLDSARDKVKAGILISPEGDKFIKTHPGVLRELDRALAVLERTDGHPPINKVAEVKGLGTLQARVGGRQSNFYVLTLGGENFAIKTHLSFPGVEAIHQPYLNEMLQTQSLSVDLKDQLSSIGVRMSDFMFASGQVSCTRYYGNTYNYSLLSEDRVRSLQSMVLAYVESKKSDPLWENIYIDLVFQVDEHGRFSAPIRNFRMQADGTAVWVDPFVCYRPDSVAEK